MTQPSKCKPDPAYRIMVVSKTGIRTCDPNVPLKQPAIGHEYPIVFMKMDIGKNFEEPFS